MAARAPVPLEVRTAFVLAGVNFALAVVLGVLQAADHLHPFLPFPFFGRVFAHAHLAAVGWALLMVMAAGYRLFPMLLPAAMPSGRAVWASVVGAEVGLGLLATGMLLGATPVRAAGALLVAAAVALFLSRLVWMVRHRRPVPPERPRPDWALAHVAAAFVCARRRHRLRPGARAVAAAGAGGAAARLRCPRPARLPGADDRRRRAAPHRLARLDVGLRAVALPGDPAAPGAAALAAARGGDLPALGGRTAVLLLAGLGAGLPAAVGGGGLLLALGTVTSLAQQVRVLRRAHHRRPRP